MSERCPELAEITAVIDLYIDGVKNGNVDSLRKAFHPQSSMFGYKGEDLFVTPIEGLFDYIAGTTPPAKAGPVGEQYATTITGISVTGAAATVEMAMDGYHEHDFRGLLPATQDRRSLVDREQGLPRRSAGEVTVARRLHPGRPANPAGRLDPDLGFGLGGHGLFRLPCRGLQPLPAALWGTGPEFIGLLNGVAMGASALCAIPAGMAGRRWGLRRVMLAGFAIWTVMSFLLPLADLAPATWQTAWLLATFTITWMAVPLWGVNQPTYMVGITSPVERQHTFAISRASSRLGAMTGSLLAGLLVVFLADRFDAVDRFTGRSTATCSTSVRFST